MTELSALWLPILLGAVVCFIASSIIHMTPLWHKNEYPPLPDEDRARAAIGALNVPPGDYTVVALHRKAAPTGMEQAVEVTASGAKADFTLEVK